MGYTHYWQRPPQLPAPAFGRAVLDCQRVLPETNIPLAGTDGTGRPLFKSDAIVFNGLGASAHETFAVRRAEPDRGDGRPVFSFCKTSHQPYDVAVQVALIVFKHHLEKQFRVSSDGEEVDWERARQVCQRYLGYGGDFRLENS